MLKPKKFLVSLKELMATCPLLRATYGYNVFAYKHITTEIITQTVNAARSPAKKIEHLSKNG